MNDKLGLGFDPEALQLLRRVQMAAGGKRVGVEHLHQAIEHPCSDELPSVTLKLDDRAAGVLERASELAQRMGAGRIGAGHIYDALVEEQALSAGLNVPRLQFARRWILRKYAVAPAARCYNAHSSSGTTIDGRTERTAS